MFDIIPPLLTPSASVSANTTGPGVSVVGSHTYSSDTGYSSGSVYQHDQLLHPYPSRKLPPDPLRKTADNISKLIESTPECRGLAIMIPEYTELNDMSEFLTNTCRFAVFNPPANPTHPPLGYTASSFPKSVLESLHLVELNHVPIVVVVRGEGIDYRRMYSYGTIDIENDIVKPLFSRAASHLADNPKIFRDRTNDYRAFFCPSQRVIRYIRNKS